MCISYETAQRQLDKLGTHHDESVVQWADQVCKEHNSDEPIDPNNRHPGYQLVSDNLDIRVTARHSTARFHGADHHMFNMLAIKIRISPWHLPYEIASKSEQTTTP